MSLAPSADILLRKMLGRTLAQGRAVARDAYDFVVALAVDADEDERVAMRDFFVELDGLEIAQVMRAAGATPRRMAELFHELGVRQWQAVLCVNQFSSHPETPEMRYWDKFAQGSLRFDLRADRRS